MSELVWLGASVMVAGFVTGILAGLFGIGGGAVIVPVLFEVFRLVGVPEAVRMQLCIGTSLAIIVPTAVTSYRAHKARGFVLREVIRRWALPSMAGVAVGSALAALAPPDMFKAAFVVIACLIAAKLLVGGGRWVLGTELPGAAAMTGYGFAIGLGSSLMGIAGGSLVTMTLTLYGKPDPQRSGDCCGPWGTDHARRHHRLCSRRPAASGAAAAAVSRFRLRDRRRPGRPDLELGRTVRRPPGAQTAKAQARNRVWPFPGACGLALSRKSRRLGDLNVCGYPLKHWREQNARPENEDWVRWSPVTVLSFLAKIELGGTG